MRVSNFVLGILLATWSSTAPAAWQVAKSKHFIIYADDRPRLVQDFATKLERFDQAARPSSPPTGSMRRDPEPLLDFYQAFAREGVRPTANAIEALHYASNLEPQDVGVRMNSALAYLNDG